MLLYVRTPSGPVMVIVPVGTVQVGWIKVAVGVAGPPGIALIIKLAVEVHPFPSLTIMV